MTAYPLEALLSVRRFREESAARALRRANDAVREARRALDASLTALEDWRARLPEEVDRRYRAILGQTLSTEDLARFHLGLAELASHEVQLAAEVDRCRSACDACERAAQYGENRKAPIDLGGGSEKGSGARRGSGIRRIPPARSTRRNQRQHGRLRRPKRIGKST